MACDRVAPPGHHRDQDPAGHRRRGHRWARASGRAENKPTATSCPAGTQRSPIAITAIFECRIDTLVTRRPPTVLPVESWRTGSSHQV